MTAHDAHGPIPGHYDSPFPAEDGGPRRQMVPRVAGLRIAPGEMLGATSRAQFMCNMVVLRAPGEVFLQGSTPPGPDNSAWLERIDPVTLAPLARSPELPAGGVWWAGGVVAHANGFLYLTHGRYCHKLDVECRLQRSCELPRANPYNSLLVLSDGNLVMKDCIRDGSAHSFLTVLDPEKLRPIGGEVEIPEASIARIAKDVSAAGEFVYVVGERTIYRFRYERGVLSRDTTWAARYRTLSDAEQSYGWDPVIADGFAWFMDNGDYVFNQSLSGGGVASGPLHVFRVDLAEAHNMDVLTPFALPRGTITNPPLVDASRRIVVAYDSGNARLAAFRYGAGGFERLWEHGFGASTHFLLYADSGEIVVNDFQDATGEQVVVLDIESGAERGRVRIDSPVQSVVFQACGFDRDLYCCTFAGIARVFVQSA